MSKKNRREFLESGGAAIGAGMALSPGWLHASQSRKIQLETDRAYDPSKIPAYAGRHQDIYDHIDAHRDEHIGKIQEYLRQRSISAQNVGMRECAEMTASYLREIGASDAKLVPTKGHPVVWGPRTPTNGPPLPSRRGSWTYRRSARASWPGALSTRKAHSGRFSTRASPSSPSEASFP